MDLALYAAGLIGALILEGVTMFFFFRGRIAKADLAVADVKKRNAEVMSLLAERDRIIEDKGKIIAEQEKMLAEVRKLGVDTERAKLDLIDAEIDIQDRLKIEFAASNKAQEKLADVIEDMTKMKAKGGDCSDLRNRTVRILSAEVITSFGFYLDKAVISYRTERAEKKLSFVKSDVLSFVLLLNSAVDVLNEPSLLSLCGRSPCRFEVTAASLGSVQRAFIELVSELPPDEVLKLRALIPEGGVSKLLLPASDIS